MRSLHKFQYRFDVSPRFGVFGLTFFFIAAGSLRSRNDGLLAIGFKHLPRIVMNLNFAYPHDIVLAYWNPDRVTSMLIRAGFKSFPRRTGVGAIR